ncbi:hypothetical protein K466DRAFT_506271, partial [Polyporus arcularius HHB13444]
DDFKVEFHPRANKAPEFARFEDFKSKQVEAPVSVPKEPWLPFKSRLDFEFSEFCAEAGLNKRQIDSVLKLVQRAAADPTQLHIKTAAEMSAAWERAKPHQPAFEKTVIEVPYNKSTLEFDVHTRSLWKWALAMIRDPTLAQHIVWDAVKQFKFTNGKWMRFWDEPNTADYWWDIQTVLPDGGHPVAYILYADKTRLSSFGTKKGYPIVARLANMSVEIRNGEAYGGGQVVGFLPIVEDEDEEGKLNYTNLKRVVWHEAFWVLLREFKELFPIGHKTRCGDGVERLLYPVILILSADYEEQCMMANIRGTNGLAPCPICLVPRDMQQYLKVPSPHAARNWRDVQEIVEKRMTKEAKEALLQPGGWRPVPNVFWKVPGCDVHRALSFDRLHFYHGGVFSDHLMAQWQSILQDAARDVCSMVNKQFSAMPSWSDFNHFTHVTSVNFADGSKYEDISKVLVPACYNVFSRSEKRWMALMRAIRCYTILDVYSGLVVQTESTLESYAKALLDWADAVMEYQTIFSGKEWNFPKNHLQDHLLRDIKDKGVTRNYNTKISEHMHVLLKAIYQNQTNFKDVEEQLGNFDHILLVVKKIRHHLNLLDEKNGVAPPTRENKPLFTFGHIGLGSDDDPISFAVVEKAHVGHPEYTRFRLRVAEYLQHLRVVGTNGKALSLKGTDTITPLCYIRVDYESMEDWKLATDRLRCSPKFFGRPRYDCVIFKADESGALKFGRLKDVFIIQVAEQKYPIAFIDVYQPVTPSTLDSRLGLCRVRANKRKDHGTAFIHVQSIVRGAMLARDHASAGSAHEDYLVIDIKDGDMILRCQKNFPGWYA